MLILEEKFRWHFEAFASELFIYTVGTESIQTPLNFSLFVILQPSSDIIHYVSL